MEMFSIRGARCCWICGKAAGLENCRMDEHGLPVHEECYVAREALNSMRPRLNEDDPAEVRKLNERLA